MIKYVYPALIVLAGLCLFFINLAYYKGMALGFVVLFVATHIIDYGFVSRSENFLEFLSKI